MNAIGPTIHAQRLETRRAEIVNMLAYLDGERRGAEENRDCIDPAAYAARIGLFNRLVGWYLDEIAGIDQALIRIAENRYGACIACHRTIEPMRLDAAPEAAFCASCQELREQIGEA